MRRIIHKQQNQEQEIPVSQKYKRVTYEDSASLSMEYRQQRIKSVFRPRPNIFLKEG